MYVTCYLAFRHYGLLKMVLDCLRVVVDIFEMVVLDFLSLL